jgi:hypothetical protein
MTLDFTAATDPLVSPIKLEDLAKAIGCSLASVKQARMAGEKDGKRAAPPGWEAAVARLARQKAVQLQKLADKLS